MHVYTVHIKREDNGGATAEVHHVGKNFKLDLFNNQVNSWGSHAGFQQSQKDGPLTDHGNGSIPTPTASTHTPSGTPVPPSASPSVTKMVRPHLESRSISALTNSTTDSLPIGHSNFQSASSNHIVSIPPTPSSATSTQFNEEFMMLPPSEIPQHHYNSVSSQHLRTRSHSRQSSVVSNQTMSPSALHPMRSPSPVPPLPAIHINEDHRASTVLLYGDEGASAFFRRLSWSLDGSMLISPAGRWENQQRWSEKRNTKGKEKQIDRRAIHSSGGKRKRKKKGVASTQLGIDSTDEDEVSQKHPGDESTPTVFIYGRGTLASSTNNGIGSYAPLARLPGHKTSSLAIRFSPVFYELKKIPRNQACKSSAPPPVKIDLAKGKDIQQVDLKNQGTSTLTEQTQETPTEPTNDPPPPETEPEQQDTVFHLPYRMVYAVATHDTVFVYDTQQSSPICMFGNLHFSSFTDLTWCVCSSYTDHLC